MHPLPASLLPLLLLLAPNADGWLGVYLATDRPEAVVAEVIPGSPAAKAGLQPGDVLLAVGDQPTATRELFIAAIRAAAPGQRVSLKIRRQDKESTVVVKLGERPEQVAVAPVVPRPPAGQPAQPSAEPGPAVPPAGPRGYLGIAVLPSKDGLRIDRVLAGGPAAAAGVRAGELLQSIGDLPVGGMTELDRLLADIEPGQRIALGLRSEDGVRSVLVEVGRRHGSAPEQAAPPKPEAQAKQPAAKPPVDLEAELEALRAELRELRRQVEELRKASGQRGGEPRGGRE